LISVKAGLSRYEYLDAQAFKFDTQAVGGE
jgi:hypothetical protein